MPLKKVKVKGSEQDLHSLKLKAMQKSYRELGADSKPMEYTAGVTMKQIERE